MRANELISALRHGEFDEKLRTVYGARPLGFVYGRIESVVEGFCERFDPEQTRELSQMLDLGTLPAPAYSTDCFYSYTTDMFTDTTYTKHTDTMGKDEPHQISFGSVINNIESHGLHQECPPNK